LIHRDIKPANILLEAGTGKVLLTDFGLARASEDVKLTQTGFVAGTPLYMSPEQARGEPLDHRSDLFSLGSVLYAMCTGNPPFQGSSPFVVLREVTEGRHRPIQEINPNIPPELVAVIDHLLAKKPDDRIQSASEVAALLGQAWARLPVDLAQPSPSKTPTRTLPRLYPNWWRRHGGLIAAIVLAANGLLLLSETAEITHWTVLGQRGQTAAEEPAPQPKQVLDALTGPIWSVAFAPDGETVAAGVDDGSVRLWNAHTGQKKSTISAQEGPIWKIAFSPDGTILATVSDDGNVRLWDPATSKEIDTIPLNEPVRAVAFSPDGSRLVAGTRKGSVRVYDTKTGKLLMPMAGHKKVVMALAWSADGKLVASASGDHTIKIWDVTGETAKEVTTFAGHTGGVYTVAFHPDPARRLVASGSWDHTIRLWDIDKGIEIGKLEGHHDDVWSVAFSGDGKMLASGSEDRTAKLWDPIAGTELRTLKGLVGTIYAVGFSPDGTTLATAGRDGKVKLWDIAK
jgi:hypothetical protein